MKDIIRLAYDIICAYFLKGEVAYTRSIRTCLRGPKTYKAPVAQKFSDYYFYGLRKEISDDVLIKATNYLAEKGYILKTYSEKNRDYRYEPSDPRNAIVRLNKIIKNKHQLRDEYA